MTKNYESPQTLYLKWFSHFSKLIKIKYSAPNPSVDTQKQNQEKMPVFLSISKRIIIFANNNYLA